MVFVGCLASVPSVALGQTPWDWALTGYAGPLTFNNSSDIFLEGDFEADGAMIGVGLGKPVASLFGDRMWIELDGSVFARLTEDDDYFEIAGVALARWTDFPWDDSLDTSAAVGYGLSYTSEVPDRLTEKDENAPNLIGALVVELEGTLPQAPDMSLVLRYHHRSAAFGTFGTDGAFDDSTVFLFGLRYRFGAFGG